MSKNDTKVIQSFGRVVANNAKMIWKVARLTPEYVIGMIFEGVIWGAINASNIFFTNELFNAFDNGLTFPQIASILGLMALFYALGYAFNAWYWKYFNPLVRIKLEYKLHKELYTHAIEADLSSYDDPEFYNDFVIAMEKVQSNAIDIMENLGKIINRIVSSSAIITIMLGIDPLALFVLFASAVIRMVAEYYSNLIDYKNEKEATPVNRRINYVGRVFRLKDNAKELRISRASENMDKLYDDSMDERLKIRLKYNLRYFLIWEGIIFTSGTISNVIIMLRMIYLLGEGAVLLGGFAAAITATWRFRWLITDLIERFTKFPKFSLFVEQYLTFIGTKPKLVSGNVPVGAFESLELRNVSFTYEFSGNARFEDIKKATSRSYRKKAEKDGSTKNDTKTEEKTASEALRNVSLSIRKGEKVALVGYNGAGKTTLIKLIMRLYDPTEGQILYNGRDIREYDINEYRKHISVIFQDYKIFAATIAENVLCATVPEEKRAEITDALEKVTFGDKLQTLEKGIDTMLTREFDKEGTELSGGESQKVAIARALVSPSELLIMDEPSSALDPKAEYALNKAILDSTAERTVVFISHRLSTTTIADKIYMFEGGKLTESGSHPELLDKCGSYAEMFNLQAEKYKNENN